MEKKKVLPFAVVGVFLLTSAVISQAGDWMDKSSGSETQVSQEMEIAEPEFGMNEYGEGGAPAEFWGPVETGTLPGSDASPHGSESSVDSEDPFNFNEANY